MGVGPVPSNGIRHPPWCKCSAHDKKVEKPKDESENNK